MNKTSHFFVVLFLGYLGIHKFMEKKTALGIAYLFTCGLFGIGWIIDIIKAFKDDGILELIQSKKETTYEVHQKTIYINKDIELELAKIDAMSTDGFQFEHYCAELLKKTGFSDAKVTQGSGDYGIDILAEKEGVSYAIQCKCYSNPVGNKSVQEAYSGKEFYKSMVAVVLTNSTFTYAAKETAKQTRVLLWDREKLKELILLATKDVQT